MRDEYLQKIDNVVDWAGEADTTEQTKEGVFSSQEMKSPALFDKRKSRVATSRPDGNWFE